MLFENEPSGGPETESASISEDCSTNNTHRNEITSIPSNDTSEETLKREKGKGGEASDLPIYARVVYGTIKSSQLQRLK